MLTVVGREHNTLGGEPIKIWGFDYRMTVTANIAVEIVSHDKKDIERPVGGFWNERRHREAEEKGENYFFHKIKI